MKLVSLFFLLIAGAGAYYPLPYGGALTFDVYTSPSDLWWGNGSAY